MDVPGVVASRVGDLGQASLARQAVRHESVAQLDGGGQEHGLGEGFLNLDDAVRVLGPCRRDPARPAQLHAGARLVHAVGEQRGGQGVARVARQVTAPEDELQGGVAVDPAACGQPERRRSALVDLAHGIVGFCSSRR